MQRLTLLTFICSAFFIVGCAGSSSSSTSAQRPSKSITPGTAPATIEEACIDTAPASADLRRLREEICELTNSERSKLGLPFLRLDSDLTEVAQGHAEDMALNNYFSHTSPSAGTFTDRLKADGISYSTAGENIARNTVIDAQTIMNQWMTSSGHKANILKSSYGRLGVGQASGRWVQLFTN